MEKYPVIDVWPSTGRVEVGYSTNKPCSICGKYPNEIGGKLNYSCGHSQPVTAEPPKAGPDPFARDRRHNYRTDGIPPQGTDKHIDELK